MALVFIFFINKLIFVNQKIVDGKSEPIKNQGGGGVQRKGI